MKPDEIGAATARLLFDAGAVHLSRGRPFILAAGWASPVYIDCRLLISEPRHRKAVTELAVAAIKNTFSPTAFDAVAGAETAGMPFASWLADALDLPLRYVRKRPLGVGRNAQVEGGAVEGLRVLLVDDLTTDAQSKVAFSKGLRAAGAEVTDSLTVFYHSAFPGAADRLARADLSLHALATWRDVLMVRDQLEAEDRELVQAFLADPVACSTRHGGRSARS
jgi:orotate phosphoribosyltransferase